MAFKLASVHCTVLMKKAFVQQGQGKVSRAGSPLKNKGWYTGQTKRLAEIHRPKRKFRDRKGKHCELFKFKVILGCNRHCKKATKAQGLSSAYKELQPRATLQQASDEQVYIKMVKYKVNFHSRSLPTNLCRLTQEVPH